MMKRREAIGILTGFGFSTTIGSACLWDTDTLQEEIAIRPTLWDLLLGQFPHHGDAYYQTRIDRLGKAGDLDVVAYNDLAVAHVRLQEFDQAWKALDAAQKIKPNHYETLSNMGVTAKKQGDFLKGAEYIAKALELKPEGHMGLGDWYLKALRWRAEFENATEEDSPTENFLGKSYISTFRETDYGERHSGRGGKPVLEDRYEQLIRNDQSFADGFVAVGDALNFRGDLNLSFFAYTRAMMLGHQNPLEVERRRSAFQKYKAIFSPRSDRKSSVTDPEQSAIASAEKKINGGLAWLDHFKNAEADLLKGKSDERGVTITHVEAELSKRGIRREQPA